MATATEHKDETRVRNEARDTGARSDDLRDSPTMRRLLDALERGEDVGHYGRLVFAMVARFFMDGDRIVQLLAQQPDQDDTKARATLKQVEQHGYNPPRRDRILAWQSQQDFQIVDPDDPDSGNLYRELRFPDSIYDNIEDYYEEKVEADEG